MRKNKKVLVVIIVISILVIACTICAYLYIATDAFKSNKELFAKYFGQNEEMFQKITDLKTIETYKNLKNESKYESNASAKISYSEGGEISNPLNNLTAKLDVQKNSDEQYKYIEGKILYGDEEYLEAEFIKEQHTVYMDNSVSSEEATDTKIMGEQDLYGIRVKDAIQQFILVENNENFNEIMNEIGLTTEQTEDLMKLIKEQTNIDEEITTLKNKYLNIVKMAIANGEFSKQKNTVITYNNNIVKTNEYSVLLTSKQVENLLIEILNNVKNETALIKKIGDKEKILKKIDESIEKISGEIEIPTIKITVYENKKNTIRTIFEVGEHNILIENVGQKQEYQTKINYSNLSGGKTIQFEIDMNRAYNENEEQLQITANMSKGEESFSTILTNTMRLSQGLIQVDTELGYKQEITTIKVNIENKINVGQDFEKRQTLGAQNSKSLNSIKSEIRKDIIKQIKSLIMQKIDERIDLLKEKIGINNSENEDSGTGTSQTEINKFNAKFEFYTGEEVSIESVKMLLDVAKNNMNGYELLNNETSENVENATTKDNKLNVKLNIEKDKTDEEGVKEILGKINTSKKYKVSIKYNDTNGLIDYIIIAEI